MNTWTSIHLSILPVCIFDQLSWFFIYSFSFAWFPLEPSIISTFGHFKDLTHTKDRKFFLMILNKPVFHYWDCAKILTAFLICSFLAGLFRFLFLIALFLLQEMFNGPSLGMPLHHELQILCTICSIHCLVFQNHDLFMILLYYLLS